MSNSWDIKERGDYIGQGEFPKDYQDLAKKRIQEAYYNAKINSADKIGPVEPIDPNNPYAAGNTFNEQQIQYLKPEDLADLAKEREIRKIDEPVEPVYYDPITLGGAAGGIASGPAGRAAIGSGFTKIGQMLRDRTKAKVTKEYEEKKPVSSAEDLQKIYNEVNKKK